MGYCFIKQKILIQFLYQQQEFMKISFQINLNINTNKKNFLKQINKVIIYSINYYNFGQTLNRGNIDFIYAQTCDTFEQTKLINIKTKKEEFVGSFNEDFKNIEEDIEAFIIYAEKNKYKNIYFAGHSLGANKIIYYLSRPHDKKIKKFILLSPTNIIHLLNGVTEEEKAIIKE